MSFGKGPWSDEELEVFKYCFQRVEEGCKTSTEMEGDIRKKIWWVTATTAYRLVRVWFRNRQDIRDILNMRANVISPVLEIGSEQGPILGPEEASVDVPKHISESK